ncbi:MAG: zf-HC2 domain-containing protein [Rhodothermales bacterium]
MTTSQHITGLLSAYLDGELPAEERARVDQHLASCEACKAAFDGLKDTVDRLHRLPPALTPPEDLWAGISARLQPVAAPGPADARPPRRAPAGRGRSGRRWPYALAGVLVLGATIWAAIWALRDTAAPAWEVVSVEGSPAIAAQRLVDTGRLRVGDWLETDASSRARVEVGAIGQVDVAPGTRLQLRGAGDTDHRLALEQGRIEAFIWAPPRLFFVETPSALATDLGCIYTLSVDSTGASLLHVTSGYVELERDGRAVLVPAGAMCLAHREKGPGTPFDEQASPALREALRQYDFEDGGLAALERVLAEATSTDVITLWQLLLQVEAAERAAVFERLTVYEAPPEGVTRDGILRLDPEMVERWARRLGHHVDEPAS